jgi:mono/diheme cytochrome c family protein
MDRPLTVTRPRATRRTTRRLALAIAALPFAAAAQNAPDLEGEALAAFTAGEALYAEQCAVCHQADGSGTPPDFPALRNNANLVDIGLIVENVHLGKGTMPAFPDLGPEQVTALATYLRNAWSNRHGPADAAIVTAMMEGFGETDGAASTIWDGIYTEAQAAAGEQLVVGACYECHGTRLDGASLDPDRKSTPPIARYKFLRNWEDRSVASLHAYIKTTMPPSAPGYLEEAQYSQIIAHLLAVSNVPAGDTELSADTAALAGIVIKAEAD